MVSDQPGTASQPTRYTRSTRQLRHAGTWSRGRRRRRRVRLCSDQSHRGVLAWLLGFSIAGIVSVAEHGERDHRPNGAMGVLATVLPNGTVDSPPFVKGLSIGNFGSLAARFGLKSVWLVSMAQATARTRSATERRGAGMTVALAPKSGVFDPASLVVLYGDAAQW
jgi:hypothetical protein